MQAADYEQKINYHRHKPKISSKKWKSELCNSSGTVCTNGSDLIMEPVVKFTESFSWGTHE